MFEISFGEIVLISVIALIVLGPERLPTVARTLGALIGRAQRFVASVKSDMHEQAAASGLTGLQQDIRDAADGFRSQVEGQVSEVNRIMQNQEAELKALAEDAAQPLQAARDTLSGAVADPVPPAEADPQALIEAAHRDEPLPGALPSDAILPPSIDSEPPAARADKPFPNEHR